MSNYHCTNNCGTACPPPQQPSHGCACGESFQRALKLLCRSPISAAVNFNGFAFLSDHYILGSPLKDAARDCQAGDNLEAPAASWFCGEGCDEGAVSGALYPPIPGARGLCTAVHQVHLCNLTAIVFEAMADPTESTDPFRVIRQGLAQLLQPGTACGSCDAPSTLVAGPLVVEDAVILGQLGTLVIAASPASRRFYLICTQKLDFLG